MRPRSAASRSLCAALAAALALSSFGPRGAAAAQEIAAGAASARASGAPLVLPPASAPLAAPLSAPALLAAPSLSPLASAPSAAAPLASAAAAAAATSAAPAPAAAEALAAPAADAPRAAPSASAPAAAPALPTPAPASARALVPAAAPSAAAADEAAARLDALFDASRRAGKVPSAPATAAASTSAAPRLARADAARANAAAAEIPARAERENRSAYFPLGLSAAAAVVGAALKGAGAVLSVVAAAHAAPAALGVAAVTAFALSGLLALNAVVDAVVYGVAMRRGRGTTDEQFRDFVRGEVLAGRLDSNAAALLKVYRPQGRTADLTFAFAARGSIWIRPELISVPTIFRLVLVHELNHWKAAPTRGPPGRGVRGVLSRAYGESVARAAELRGAGALKNFKVSALERALRQAQVSLRRENPYEILVLNPGSPELKDPKLYEGLSDGAATVVAREGAEPAAALGEAAGKDYRAVVLGGPSDILPKPESKESARLESTLTQLDSLYVLATRLVSRPDAFTTGSADARAYSDLADKAARLRRVGASPRVLLAFETEVRRFWRQIAATRLKGVGAADLVDRLYGGLRDRGTAFLSFGPDDHGVKTWERLLRYWESEEGGQFRVARVDLEDGGHILILRKLEPRVGLWLRPVRGGSIAVSVPRASDSAEGRALARQALLDAGFADQLETFDQHDVVVRHVFGADVGRQEIYVTVPRRRAAAIRRFVQARAEATIGRSEANFQTHLVESGEIQDVPPVWKAGITGAGGKIMWIDTGADATHEDFAGRLDVVDMVDEGPEDWVGHGTHVAGISISGGTPFTGMAKGAHGTMAKVFSRDGNGASDGEIMGSAAIAQQKGYDVISLSLGSRGSSADNLSEFLSALTRQKNSAGEYPIVSASAGNAGPFDKTLSQPAAGVDVLAVAAAAKSVDDGRPEVSFYSSVGPDVDRRFAAKRLRLKPEIAGIGGDVTTAPGSNNVYKFGVYSAKSKDAPRSPSDLEDGRHTGMSGTSMSNPAVAGIALLVKLAMKTVGAFTPFVADNLPFAVKAVLMRTAKDLEAPVWFQGAGLVQAGAAVALVARTAAKRASLRVARLVGASASASDEDWAWLERLKAVADAEDRVFAQVPAGSASPAASAEGSGDEDAAPRDEPAEDEAPDNRAAADAARAAAMKRFSDARDKEIPALIAALKDPVWLVRQRAAFALLNLRASPAALALGEAALGDADARVRQMALLALAEIPTHAVDPLLRAASADPRWDVGAYAAYALARHGDRGGVERIVREMSSTDKRARFAAAWLAGQLALQASSAEAEALSARLKDPAERGNIRHLAAASLSNVADAAPQALSDRVVADLLDAAGPDNIALTRTLSRIFPIALRDREFVARLRRDPLKPVVTDFILKNKSALQKPGAMAELVQTLARAAGVPLDAPTSAPDPSGAGVAGVDAALGPLDVIVLPPAEAAPKSYADASDPAALSAALAAAGVDAAMLARFESAPRAALPLSRGFWLSVPEHTLYAFSLALQSRGLKARLVQPESPLVAAASAATGGVTLDLADDALPAPAPDADLSLVRLRAGQGVSEARVMAALESVAARAKGKGPVVIALSVAAPTGRRTALSALVDRLALSGVGVVVGAGDGGPALGTTAAPADAGFAAVVAAAAPGAGLQFYSARGTPESPRISWTENVDPLLPGEAADAARAAGTGVAAERGAAKLAVLARAMADAFAARGRPLPEGWFPWLVSVVQAAATPMPERGRHEVGAGLFDDEGRARAELDRRLGDLDAVAREAAAALEAGRAALAGPARAGSEPGLAARAARSLLSATTDWQARAQSR